MLPAEAEEEITKNLKAYSKRYEVLDEELKMVQDGVDAEEKRALLDAYSAWRKKKLAQMEAERPERERLTAHLVVDEAASTEEVTVEEIVDITEEVLSM